MKTVIVFFENNETDQGDCLTAFGCFKEMNNFFYN